MNGDFTPAEIAGADQECAAITRCVDELIAAWRRQQRTHPEPDRMNRISRFMITDVAPRFGDEYALYAAIAIAVERLAHT